MLCLIMVSILSSGADKSSGERDPGPDLSAGLDLAVAAVAEFFDEPRAGWRPAELGPRPGRAGGLVEKHHLGEVVTEPSARLLLRARDSSGSTGSHGRGPRDVRHRRV